MNHGGRTIRGGCHSEEFNRRMNVEIEVTRAADDKQLPNDGCIRDMTDIVCSTDISLWLMKK